MGLRPATSAPLFRKLSSVFLISSAVFAKASPAQQTEALSQTGGLPVVFVPNFFDLQNPSIIRPKLLRGENIDIELEFNDIELSDEDRRGLRLIQPLLEKLAAIGPDYPWLDAVDYSKNIHCSDTVVERNGYVATIEAAQNIWRRASKAWSTGKGISEQCLMPTGAQHGNRYITITKMQCAIGCQTLKRSEIEFIARHYGWAPVIA